MANVENIRRVVEALEGLKEGRPVGPITRFNMAEYLYQEDDREWCGCIAGIAFVLDEQSSNLPCYHTDHLTSIYHTAVGFLGVPEEEGSDLFSGFWEAETTLDLNKITIDDAIHHLKKTYLGEEV